jgi:hypothetical protein
MVDMALIRKSASNQLQIEFPINQMKNLSNKKFKQKIAVSNPTPKTNSENSTKMESNI